MKKLKATVSELEAALLGRLQNIRTTAEIAERLIREGRLGERHSDNPRAPTRRAVLEGSLTNLTTFVGDAKSLYRVWREALADEQAAALPRLASGELAALYEACVKALRERLYLDPHVSKWDALLTYIVYVAPEIAEGKQVAIRRLKTSFQPCRLTGRRLPPYEPRLVFTRGSNGPDVGKVYHVSLEAVRAAGGAS